MIVAVTGIGLVGPAGVGLEASLARLNEGPLVAEAVPAPEGDAFDHPRALRVPPEFKPRAWLKRRKDLKLMARANQLAVAAGTLAVRDAGLEGQDLSAAGLFLAVGREPGSLKDVLPPVSHSLVEGEVSLDRLIDEGMGWMNPLSSLKTLPNMSLAHVSIVLGVQGPSQTLCAGPESGPQALREAAAALVAEQASVVIAGAADARVDFTDRSAARREGKTEPMGEAAALFVLEPLAAAKARGAQVYGTLSGQDFALEVPQPLGDCGAATIMVHVALELGAGNCPTGTAPGPHGAPALHLRRRSEAVAITGVGLRTPLGDTLADFSERLRAGHSATGAIQAFDATRFPVRNACEVANFALDVPDALRAAIEGLDDRKAELALSAAMAAVQDFGGLPAEAGLVYATGLSSVSVTELSQDCAPFITAEGAFDYAAFGAAPTPGRQQAPLRHQVDRPLHLLREHLGLTGPSACHFSACAAGAAAIGHAADLVRRGEADCVLAGAGDSMVHPFGMLPFILLGATSTETDPSRAGRPFDKDRDGFVMGEAGAFFVLERLETARAAGRHIYGTLLGWGSSVDAHNVTAPHPEGLGAELAIRRALRDARLEASRVGYINAHGTGTALNDTIEAAAIRRVFGDAAPPVSSSKAQFGHTIAAAGAVELLACLAAFDGGLPPNPHTEHVDPRVDLDLVGKVARPAQVEVVLSNSFGFGGQNACLAIARPEVKA